MSVDQLVSEALKLPARDRASLAALLWEGLDDPYTAMPLDSSEDEVLALSDKRNAEIESGAVIPLSHDDLMNRLR